MKRKERVLVYGGSGLVGSRIVELLGENFEIYSPSHSDVDVTHRVELEKNIDKFNPRWIIYSAGLTKMDIAEENPSQAYLLNSEVPGWISQIAADNDIRVCYLSTDAVFDAKQRRRPYKESDQPSPVNVYGESKFRGEKNVLSASRKNLIVRFCMPYSSHFDKKLDFARLVLKVLTEGKSFAGIEDQMINPIFIDDLVFAIKTLIMNGACGIYHLGSKDYVSNYEFAKKVAKTFDLDEKLVTKMTFSEFSKTKKTKRGKYWWLATSKFQKEMDKKILHSNSEGIALLKDMLL